MPFPRFRIRTLMIAVAAVGLLSALTAEVIRERGLASEYRRRAAWHSPRGAAGMYALLVCPDNPNKAAYHASMREKYERAARCPWLPVPPDPPEPD